MKNTFGFILLLLLTSFLPAQERNFDNYSIVNLQNYPFRTSPITIQRLAFKNDIQYAYNVVYTSMGLTVSARFSVPNVNPQDIKGIVIMLRGHQGQRGYYTGRGTENPARRYLQNGWAVIAPDFFGYGSSSPTPAPWEMHQFYCTINAVELYKSLQQPVFRFNSAVAQADRTALPSNFKKIVLWGHSNGGQAALHFLQVIREPVSTVLWAPVSITFPENIAHFNRNTEWVRRFRENHARTIDDFSLLKNLDKIAPGTAILLEQGTRDTAVPRAWNDALAAAINTENNRRRQAGIGIINLRYEVYTNADHNLNPFWNTVLPGNVRFWDSNP
ncbi:MAG: alpha/beta fold hydrolase [Treponema sp.]|nr:alpha/beta fold hydrolase [Treponema sp.]